MASAKNIKNAITVSFKWLCVPFVMHERANGVGKRSVFCSCVRIQLVQREGTRSLTERSSILPKDQCLFKKLHVQNMDSLEALLIIDFSSYDKRSLEECL